MDIYTPIKKHLEACKTSDLEILSSLSGISIHTINKIKSGETKNPGVLTIQPLFLAIEKTKASK